MRVFDKASAEDAAGTVQWSRYLSGSLGSRYWRRRDDRILARVPEGSGPVLDLGCGEGRHAVAPGRTVSRPSRAGPDGSGTFVRRRSHGGCPRKKGRSTLPYADASADCCLLLEVIEHLDRPEEVLGRSSAS